MKTIITGASGHFGRLATQGLLARVPASDLILVTRNPDTLAETAPPGARVRGGDFDDPGSLEEAFEGGDRMLLISATRVGQRVPQHGNAISAAKAAGVQHVAYTSFINAVPENPSLAVSDHCGTEALLRESGMAWTALRNSQYTDFILAAAPAAVQTGVWQSNAGDGRLAHVTRQDCVNCAVEVLSSTGHENVVYDVTGPELLSMGDIAAVVAEATGRPIEYIHATDEEMYGFFDSLGVPRSPIDDHVASGIPWCSDDMVSFGQTIREGGFEVISDTVERLTGVTPQSMRDYVFEHLEQLKADAGPAGAS